MEIDRFIETIGHGVKDVVIVVITDMDFGWTHADDWTYDVLVFSTYMVSRYIP